MNSCEELNSLMRRRFVALLKYSKQNNLSFDFNKEIKKLYDDFSSGDSEQTMALIHNLAKALNINMAKKENFSFYNELQPFENQIRELEYNFKDGFQKILNPTVQAEADQEYTEPKLPDNTENISRSFEEKKTDFEAQKSSSLSTTQLETLSALPSHPGFDKVNPNTVTQYKVQRKIIKTIVESNLRGEPILYGEKGKTRKKLVLDVVADSALPQDKLIKGTEQYVGKGHVLVVRDENGQFVYFDKDGNISDKENGELAYYNFSRVEDRHKATLRSVVNKTTGKTHYEIHYNINGKDYIQNIKDVEDDSVANAVTKSEDIVLSPSYKYRLFKGDKGNEETAGALDTINKFFDGAKAYQRVHKVSYWEAMKEISAQNQSLKEIREYVDKDRDNNFVRAYMTGGNMGYVKFDYNTKTPLASVENKDNLNIKYAATDEVNPYGYNLEKGNVYAYLHDKAVPVQVFGNNLDVDTAALISEVVFNRDLKVMKNGELVPMTPDEKYNWVNAIIHPVLGPKDNKQYTIVKTKTGLGLIRVKDKTYVKDSAKAQFIDYLTKNTTFNVRDSLMGQDFTDYKLSDDKTHVVPTRKAYKDYVYENHHIKVELRNGQLQAVNSYLTFKKADEPMAKTNELAKGEVIKTLPTVEAERLFRSKSQVVSVTPVNRVINERARQWYESSPLKEFYPLEVINDVMNRKSSDPVATFAMHGITLYHGFEYADLYHEAWHGFTQGFLTKEEKVKLYNEVSKKSGSFKDYNGNYVDFQKADYKQIEEYLAEDFRKYMIDGGKKVEKLSPVKNSIFRKIYNFLKALFQGTTVEQMMTDETSNHHINKLYQQLSKGDIASYTFSADNVIFGNLNTGILATSKSETTQQLGYLASKQILDSVDSLFADYLSWYNSGISSKEFRDYQFLKSKITLGKASTKDIAQVAEYEELTTSNYAGLVFKKESGIQGAYKWTKKIMEELLERKKEAISSLEEGTVERSNIQKNIDTLRYALNNFGDIDNIKANKTGVIALHMEKSGFLDFSDKSIIWGDDTDITDEDNQSRDSFGSKAGNEYAHSDLADKDVTYLVKSLYEIDNNGIIATNELETPKLANLRKTWSQLALGLENSADITQMELKLKNLAEEFPIYKELLKKLGPADMYDIVTSVLSKEKKELYMNSRFDLWTRFNRDFCLSRIKLLELKLDSSNTYDGETEKKTTKYDTTAGYADADSKKLFKRWETSFTRNLTGSPYIKSDSKGAYFDLNAFNKAAKKGKLPGLADNPIAYLRLLGVPITDKSEIVQAIKTKQVNLSFFPTTHMPGLRKTLKKLKRLGDGKIRSLEQIFQNQYTAKNALLDLQVKSGDMPLNFMARTADGEIRFEHCLNSSVTNLINVLNKVNTLDELLQNKESWHLDPSRSPLAKTSVYLKSLFDKDGNRRRVNPSDPDSPFVTLNIAAYSGFALSENGIPQFKGVSSASADEITKLLGDIHMHGQQGVNEFMRTADKSSSFTAWMSNIYSINDNQSNDSITNKYIAKPEDFILDAKGRIAAYKRIMPIMENYISGELERVAIMRSLNPKTVGEYDSNYIKNGKRFVMFADVLSEPTRKELYELLPKLKEKQLSLIDYLKDTKNLELRIKIRKELKSYFENNLNQIKAKLGDNLFISDKALSKFKFVRKDIATDALIRSYVANSWINNYESLIFFFGDVAQYDLGKEDFTKRIPGAVSVGRGYRIDQYAQEYVNTVLKRAYGESQGYKTRQFDGTAHTAVLEDATSTSVNIDKMKDAYRASLLKHYETHPELKKLSFADSKAAIDKAVESRFSPYKDMKEGDAQGWITMDFYRILGKLEGTWSDTNEVLYQRLARGEEVPDEEVTEFIPVLKLQHYGPLINRTDLPPMWAFHKFSLMPLIPNFIKGSKLEALHNKMMKEGIDYALFQTGSKICTVTNNGVADKFYGDNDNRVFNEGKEYTHNIISLKNLKKQQETNSKFKGNSIFSTQQRKLVIAGMMETGVPVDYTSKETNVNKRKAEWDKLSETEKGVKSEKYQKLLRYESHLKKFTDLKLDSLLKEFSLEKSGDNYVAKDVNKLVKKLRQELSKQDLAEHELEFLKTKDGKLLMPLDLNLSTEKIEKVLNSIFIKKVIRQKVKGEPLTLVSGAGFESAEAPIDINHLTPAHQIAMNFEDGTGGREMRPEYKGKSTLELIKEGKRTATSRDRSKSYNQQNVKVGDIIKFNATQGKSKGESILVKVTKAPYKLSEVSAEQWSKLEGWSPKRYNELKDKGYEQFQFELVKEDKKVEATNDLPTYKPGKARETNITDEIKKLIPHRNSIFGGENGGKVFITTDKGIEIENAKGIRYNIDDILDDESDIYKRVPEHSKEQLKKLRELYWDKLLDKYLSFKDGKTTAAKIKIALQGDFFKLLMLNHKDGKPIETRDRLNEMIKDEDWLDLDHHRKMITCIATRIPSQGHNSMEFMEVHHFMPTTFGNGIIAPSEIVAKAGSDYDIDKLTTYFPNITLKDGKVHYDDSESTSEGLMNNILTDMRSMMDDPDNYSNLVLPNAVDITKPLADRLKSKARVYDSKWRMNKADEGDKAMAGTRVLEPLYNLYQHQSNKAGKQVIGIVAVDNTYNTLFDRVGAYVNSTSKIDKFYFPQNILMPHNELNINGKNVVSLSHQYDVNGINKTADIINQLINGAVDAAKDPWLFDIQGNKEVLPTLLYLVQAGVPFEQAVYFVSQPLIQKYIEEQRLVKSYFAGPLGAKPTDFRFANTLARKRVLTNPEYEFNPPTNTNTGKGQKANLFNWINKSLSNIDHDFSEKTLGDRLENLNKRNPDYNINDRLALLHYIQLEDTALGIRDIKMRTNVDTSRSKSFFETANKKSLLEELIAEQKMPYEIVQKLIDNSPISSFFVLDKQAAIWNDLYTIRNNSTIDNYLVGKIKTDKDLAKSFNNNDQAILSFKNDMYSYIMQNELSHFNYTKSDYYKGMALMEEAKQTIPKKEVSSLKHGAYVKEIAGVPTMYYDVHSLNGQYRASEMYSKDKTNGYYAKYGVAPVPADSFTTFNEYAHFVMERENQRYIHPYSEVKNTPEFDRKYRDNLAKIEPDSELDTSVEAREKRINKLTYEEYIRDASLDNIYNPVKYFKGDNTMADQLMDIKNLYSELEKKYFLLENLVYDNANRISNIRMLDTTQTEDSVTLMHSELKELADPKVKKVDDESENKRISDYFRRFNIFAFMQSGMNSSGSFSLIRIVDQKPYIMLMRDALQRYNNHINTEVLNNYYSLFMANAAMKSTKYRFKDYRTKTDINRMLLKPVKVEEIPDEETHEVKTRDNNDNSITVRELLPYRWKVTGDPVPGVVTYDYNRNTTLKYLHDLGIKNPDVVFVHNSVKQTESYKPRNANIQDFVFQDMEDINKQGIPTRASYTPDGKEFGLLTDKTLEQNKHNIDEAIDELKEKSDGKVIAFPKNGLGEYMINKSELNFRQDLNLKAGIYQAPQTFLYLSKRLYEEFGYVNPNYDMTKAGEKVIQADQSITDDEIRDQMKNCFEL